MVKINILIDADGCPVVKKVIEISRIYSIKCIIVCDSCHIFKTDYAEIITVDKGADSADFKIANLAVQGDIVVTQDYGLAAMCLAKKAEAVNQDGMIYTEDNIDALLLSRHTAKKIRKGGGRLKGPPPRTAAQDRKFAEIFAEMVRNKCKSE